MRGLTIILPVLLLAATAPAALAGEAAAIRAAIDAHLTSPADGRLVRRAERVPFDADAYPIGGAGDAESPWSFAAGLALSLAEGNSDKLDVAIDGEARYERDPSLIMLKGLFAYGESEGLTTTEAYHVTLRGERKVSARIYVFGQVDYDRDEPAELEYRWTAVGGIGVILIDGRTVKLKGEVGGGYTWEKRRGRASTQDPAAYLGLAYEKTWAGGAKLTANAKYLPNLGDYDLSLFTYEMKLAVPLSDRLALTVSLRIDHVLDPPAPAQNTDVLLGVGLRVTF